MKIANPLLIGLTELQQHSVHKVQHKLQTELIDRHQMFKVRKSPALSKKLMNTVNVMTDPFLTIKTRRNLEHKNTRDQEHILHPVHGSPNQAMNMCDHKHSPEAVQVL